MAEFLLKARTDVGRIRSHNEDNFIVTDNIADEDWTLTNESFELNDDGFAFIVADGMGGAEAGEVASEIAIQVLKERLKKNIPDLSEDKDIVEAMDQALMDGHAAILEYATENPELLGMGTTATICLIKKEKLFISWIGDSRVYRFSANGRVTSHNYFVNNLEIITNDHSVVWNDVLKGKKTPEEARVAKNSNIITQSLGDVYSTPKPEHRVFPYFKEDLILSCSDGLNGMISDDTLNDLLEEEDDLDKLADYLIDAANKAGGNDNITLVLCKVLDGPKYVVSELSKTSEEIPLNKSTASSTRKGAFLKFGIPALLLIAAGGVYLNNNAKEIVPINDLNKQDSLVQPIDSSLIDKDTTLLVEEKKDNEKAIPKSKDVKPKKTIAKKEGINNSRNESQNSKINKTEDQRISTSKQDNIPTGTTNDGSSISNVENQSELADLVKENRPPSDSLQTAILAKLNNIRKNFNEINIAPNGKGLFLILRNLQSKAGLPSLSMKERKNLDKKLNTLMLFTDKLSIKRKEFENMFAAQNPEINRNEIRASFEEALERSMSINEEDFFNHKKRNLVYKELHYVQFFFKK